MESGISNDDIYEAITDLIFYVDEVTSSASYYSSPGYDLLVSLLLIPDSHIEEAIQLEEAIQIEEAVRVSFHETNNFPLRPASKLMVKSLTRKIYEKVNSTGETTCAICLKEFINGESRVVNLPCGHDFDDECLLTWFKTNHTCPLCCFKLPCEDQN
ncbi:PREDICTED: E3 ubiquitin-protein ligase RING1-like [Camelina sativa]|uniref:E3 ubiquitin-protein ligase RING1-like n=1 Tax=Camelina sativa TaxID=90675 RepID=A0ABM0VXX9_CAMSA|nr:PREDICTED: E3 ubiquitin-protein ligase RING1-like [Camelina sativa]